MFAFRKSTSNAIAIMSYLAVEHGRRISSIEIAEVRGISKALTAKLLTQLASRGLVAGQSGPKGGYTLAKPADDICLKDIASVFEQTETPLICPLGVHWREVGVPCPMHNAVEKLQEAHRVYLEETRLSLFIERFSEFLNFERPKSRRSEP